MRGVQVLKCGVIWRVGNGEKINIWSDPWLSRGSTRAVCTPKGRNILSNVAYLFDPYTGEWDISISKRRKLTLPRAKNERRMSHVAGR